MAIYLSLFVLGIVYGCIYALSATGLVVTYTTSGIFNFAHGAIGMVGAFSYWQLTVQWGWPTWLALIAVLFVGAPLFGAVIERLLMRPLHGASIDVTLVVTLGLLLFLLGTANYIWPPGVPRRLPQFLKSIDPVTVGVLTIDWGQILVVIVALAVAVGLRVLFNRTRIGIAMRGVVDDPDLTAMAGASPARIQQLSWALGSSLAALAGILLAPIVNLESITLTLLVINGYAAALFGRLKSLPRTAVGALLLGLIAQFYEAKIAPEIPFATDTFAHLAKAVPMIFLFALLVFIPAARLRTSSAAGRATPTVPGLKQSVASAAGLFLFAVLLANTLSSGHVAIAGRVAVLGLVMLPLVLLTGYAGQTSLSHLSFVGLGAFAMGSWTSGSAMGLVYGALLAGACGALIAVSTARLRGLYLALATFAFAGGLDASFFPFQLPGGALAVERVHLFGIPTESDKAFFLLCAALFCLGAVALLAVRRGRWGRQLTALNDSPAACATLGVNTTVVKVTVFTASAALAGVAGALFGGQQGRISALDFTVLGSLALLLSLRIGGVNTVTGALFGAFTIALFPTLQDMVPQRVQLAYLLTGIAAISVGRDPDGVGGQVSNAGAYLRARFAPARTTPPSLPTYEEAQLVRS
jgi:branched-chain amino acid transport system permease protein